MTSKNGCRGAISILNFSWCKSDEDCGSRNAEIQLRAWPLITTRVIERGSSYAVVPWQMGVVGKLMRMLPDSIYDRLASGAKRKPRGLPL